MPMAVNIRFLADDEGEEVVDTLERTGTGLNRSLVPGVEPSIMA